MHLKGLSLLLLTLINITNAFSQNIKIAAAANTQFVIKALIVVFEKEEDFHVQPIFGSSGKLVAQISNGAPYHMFISADMKYVDYLFTEGHAISKPTIYAKGTCVLWTTRDIEIFNDLDFLLKGDIKNIAIPAPKNSPYGTLAIEALKENNLYDKLKSKFVFGSSISQVNQYITLGVVDVGITAKSIVMSPSMRSVGKWVDIKNQQISQGMVILTYSKSGHLENTKKFYEFLQSEAAQHIFKEHGYIID